MSIIESSRKSSIEDTAKIVAREVENAYKKSLINSDSFTVSGDDADCLQYIDKNKEEYSSCSYIIDEETGKAKITIKGSDDGQFSGYVCTDATITYANCIRGDIAYEEEEEEPKICDTGKELKYYEVTNYDKCVTSITNIGNSLEKDNDTITSAVEYMCENINEDDYETLSSYNNSLYEKYEIIPEIISEFNISSDVIKEFATYGFKCDKTCDTGTTVKSYTLNNPTLCTSTITSAVDGTQYSSAAEYINQIFCIDYTTEEYASEYEEIKEYQIESVSQIVAYGILTFDEIKTFATLGFVCENSYCNDGVDLVKYSVTDMNKCEEFSEEMGLETYIDLFLCYSDSKVRQYYIEDVLGKTSEDELTPTELSELNEEMSQLQFYLFEEQKDIIDDLIRYGVNYSDIKEFATLKFKCASVITFDPNGGTIENNVKYVNSGSNIGELPQPDRDNYLFKGWYTKPDGGLEVTENTIMVKDFTVYAHWEDAPDANVILTFDANGGTFINGKTTNEIKFYVDENNVMYKIGGKRGLVPTKSNNTFYGWYDENGNEYDEDDIYTESKTFYAKWLKHITLTFDANGGTVDKTSKIIVQSYRFGDLPTPTRSGYTFAGWYDENDYSYDDYSRIGNTYEELDDNELSLTLYAQWLKNYTLTFDANGGTCSQTSKSIAYGNYYGDLPTAVRSGYIFDGWYTEKENGNKVTEDTYYEEEEDVTVYAHWRIDTDVTLTFDANGGLFVNGTDKNYVGYDIETDREKITKTISSKNSSGERKASISDTTKYANSLNYYDDITIYGEDELDVTIYYQTESTSYDWVCLYSTDIDPTSNNYSESISGKLGGYNNGGSNYEYVYNATITGDTARIYFRTDSSGTYYGYWALVSNIVNVTSSTKIYGNPELVPTNGSYVFAGWYDDNNNEYDSKTSYSNDKIFKAKWLTKLTIYFDATGGSVSTSSKDGYYTKPYGDLPTPTREGYTFTGWYTSYSSGTKVESTTNLIYSYSHTLYAHWTPCVYTVTLDANGGSITAANGWTQGTTSTITKGVTYGDVYGDLPTPTRVAYKFDGWFTDKTWSKQITSSSTMQTKGAHTLYAKWTENSYTLTFDANGGEVDTTSKLVNYETEYGDLPTPTYYGYNFLGWYTESSGGEKVDSTTKMTTTGATIYAHWNYVTYMVPIINKLNTDQGIDKFTYDSGWNEVEENPTYVEYRYVGASPKNYVTFNNETWRIIGMFKDTSGNYQLKIIKDESIGNNYWNTTKSNVWLTSSLKSYLTNTYYPTLTASSRSMVDESAVFNTNIVKNSNDLYVSKLYLQEKTNITTDYDIESNEVIVGLMNLSDYGYAATNNCRSTYAISKYSNTICKDNDWIYNSDFQWTMNGYGSGYDAWIIYSQGYPGFSVVDSGYHSTRPVVYIKSSVVISSGTGTSTDPYVLRQNILTLNANEGIITASSGWTQSTDSSIAKDVTSASTYGDLPTPTRSGYTFKGWYTDTTYTTQVASTSSLKSTTSHTLYAKWAVNTYTLTFDANGGTVSPTSKEVVFGTAYGELPTPTYDNHTFIGWCTEKECGTEITSETIMNTEGATIYANWEEIFTVPIINKVNTNQGIEKFMYDSDWNEVEDNATYTEYRYTGYSPNNYVTFNNETWRIIGMFKDTSGNYQLKIIKDEVITRSISWDESGVRAINGLNTWSGSTMQLYLEGTYYNSLTSIAKSMMDISAEFNIGGVADNQTIKAPKAYALEKANKDVSYIGLMTLSDYGYAATKCCRNSHSLDEYSLYNGADSVCASSNWMYMNNDENWCWTMTSVSNDTNCAWEVRHEGGAFAASVETKAAGTRPVVFLKASIQISSGSGISTDPYILRQNILTLNANGGTITATDGWTQTTDSTITKDVTSLTTYGSLPEPTRENYTFLGWYTDTTYTTQVTSTSAITSTVSHALYAKWEEIFIVPIINKVNTNEGIEKFMYDSE